MTVCVYAGTFDPFTYGHHSVVLQACRLFSHVRILVADNPAKHPLFSSMERMKLIESYIGNMPHASVDATGGYVVEYANQIGATFLVRGVRDATDAAAELALASENRKLSPGIQTVLLPTDPRLSDISSTTIKTQIQTSDDYRDMSHLLTVEAYFGLKAHRSTVELMKRNGHL